MDVMHLLEYHIPRTLPELAKTNKIPSHQYVEFVAEIVKRVDAGELEFCHIESHGWQVPAVRRVLPR